MADQARFGDFILGLEGLAILRSWISDPATVSARSQKIVSIAKELEEAPWSAPIVAGERTVTAGYAEWAASYDTDQQPHVSRRRAYCARTSRRIPAWCST